MGDIPSGHLVRLQRDWHPLDKSPYNLQIADSVVKRNSLGHSVPPPTYAHLKVVRQTL